VKQELQENKVICVQENKKANPALFYLIDMRDKFMLNLFYKKKRQSYDND